MPKASSTPVLRGPSGRRAIHDYLEFESPIQKLNSLTPDSDSQDENSERESENELSDSRSGTTDREAELKKPFIEFGHPKIILPFIGALLITVVVGKYFGDAEDKSTKDLYDLSKQFPEQTADFWTSIDVAINEVIKSEKPQSILFVYDKSHSAKNLLKQIAAYAVCKLKSCAIQPIELESKYFNTPKVLSDYGTVIHDNRELLHKKGVMIVHNLEGITGESAQAFHSLCDEVNPVVGRALFLFTLAAYPVPSEKEAVGYVEKHLKVLWNDMKSDNFQPLITRMTSFVLPVIGKM